MFWRHGLDIVIYRKSDYLLFVVIFVLAPYYRTRLLEYRFIYLKFKYFVKYWNLVIDIPFILITFTHTLKHVSSTLFVSSVMVVLAFIESSARDIMYVSYETHMFLFQFNFADNNCEFLLGNSATMDEWSFYLFFFFLFLLRLKQTSKHFR